MSYIGHESSVTDVAVTAIVDGAVPVVNAVDAERTVMALATVLLRNQDNHMN